jgi:hypothetical protein
MAEVALAARTGNFRTRFAGQTRVYVLFNVLGKDRLIKTWPTGSRIELVFRFEKSKAARRTIVNTVLMIVRVLAGIRLFRTFLPQNVKLSGREQLLPFFVGFLYHLAVKLAIFVCV